MQKGDKMGTYNLDNDDIESLSDEIFDLIYDIEGDFYLRDLLSACRKAYKRLTKMRTDVRLRG